MKRDIFLLLGGNKLNLGILNKFKEKGYLVYVVDWNETPQLRGDKHYQIDVKDSLAILTALAKDDVLDRIAFAYSSIDLAVVSVAHINKAIGLQTISEKGLQYASSKSMMTNRWMEKNLLNRISRKYLTFQPDIFELNKNYKIIIKPDNSASSRGITIVEKNSTHEFIAQAFSKAQQEATNKIVVVEEFVEGTEFTVEMIGDDKGNVCVYGVSQKQHTKNADNNRIAVKLHYNAVPEELQKKIAEYGIKCYKALDFSSSFGHLEVILKEDGTISPVEIGARSSGFIASDLVDIVSGADFLGDLIKVQNGKEVNNGLHAQTKFSSIYFFYDFPDGSIVKKECCLLDFMSREVSSKYFNRENIVQGRRFAKIYNDNARLGFEILKGPKEILTPAYVASKEQKMLNVMMESNL